MKKQVTKIVLLMLSVLCFIGISMTALAEHLYTEAEASDAIEAICEQFSTQGGVAFRQEAYMDGDDTFLVWFRWPTGFSGKYEADLNTGEIYSTGPYWGREVTNDLPLETKYEGNIKDFIDISDYEPAAEPETKPQVQETSQEPVTEAPAQETSGNVPTDKTKDTGSDKQMSQTTFPGLAAKSAEELAALPNQVSGGTWPTKSKIQGVECNTDTMNTVYFSYAKYLAAYSLSGELQDSREMEGYACDMDYYDGHLLITQRRKNSLFEILVFDADDLSQYRSIQLPDVNSLLNEDKMKCSSDKVKACIDGITIAPKFGTQDELKVYVSYGVWDDASETLACLRENQIILEYDLDDVLNAKVSELSAERRLQVNLGTIKFGIQSLEYDRDTGNIWCAVRKMGQYSLFCLDKMSDGTALDLVWNGENEGWDCDAAGDGMCSFGNSIFYLLIPDYQGEQTSGTAKKAKLQ